MAGMHEKRDPAGQQDAAVESLSESRLGMTSRPSPPTVPEQFSGGEPKEPLESELSEDVQQLGITSHAGTSVDYTLMSVSIPSITVLCLMVSYTVFITALWASEFNDARNGEGKEAFEAYNPQTYEWTMIAFGVTFMVSTLQLCFERDPAKSALSFYLCYVHFCAFFSYYLFTVPGFLPVTVKHNGRGLVLGRYVEWAHTSPVLVLLCGKMAVSSLRMVVITFALNWAMLVLGLFGELFPMPWMLYFYLASIFCLFLVSRNLWWMFESAMREDTLNLNRNIVRVMRIVCLMLWWMFGVVWVVAQMNMISMETEEILYQVLDLATKAMFSSALLLGNYHTLEQRRIVAMIALEEWKRVKLIRELRNALTHKDRFLSSMSHELRTPLNGIIGLSDSVLDGACGTIDKKLRSSILTIRNSGARLQALINNILDTTSFCGNSYVLHKEKVNVHEIVDDVMFLLRPLVRQGVQLVNNIDADAVGLLGDRACIIQILYSLLGNSVKFTEKGSITVYGQLCQNDTLMAISVADTGIGIAEANLKGIFAAFQQVDMSLTRKYGGTGLGLSLVEHLVGAHGGVIEVKSKAGFGTVFTFTLPVVPASQSQEKSLLAARPSTLSLDEEPIMQDAHRTHEILVADANPEVHMKLVLLLPHCKVVKTSTSEEARSILAEHVANRSPPSLVFINVKLTPVDGYALCQLIRETYPHLDIPVILMHESTEEADLERGREVGGTDFVALPFERQELLQCVQPFLLQMETPGSFALLRTLAPSWVDSHAAELYYTHTTILVVGVLGLGSISKDEFSAKLEVLHALYAAFDELLDEQDVVKLESNGEAYVVMKGIQMQREPGADGKGGSSTSSSSTFLGTSHRQRHHNARTVLDLAAKMGKAAAALQGPDSFKGGVKLKMGVASGPLYSRELGLRSTGPCYFGDALDYARHLERLLSSSGLLMAESTFSLLEDGAQGKLTYEMREVDCPGMGSGPSPFKCYDCRMPFSDALEFSPLGAAWLQCMAEAAAQAGIDDTTPTPETSEGRRRALDGRHAASDPSMLSEEDSFTKSSSAAVGDSVSSLGDTKVGAWLSTNEAEERRRDHELLSSMKERIQILDLDNWQARTRMEEVMAQASFREAWYEEEMQKMMSAIKLLNDEVIHYQQREKMLIESLPAHAEPPLAPDQEMYFPADTASDWEGRLLYPAPLHARPPPPGTVPTPREMGVAGGGHVGYDPALGPRRRKPHSYDERVFFHPRAQQETSAQALRMGRAPPSPGVSAVKASPTGMPPPGPPEPVHAGYTGGGSPVFSRDQGGAGVLVPPGAGGGVQRPLPRDGRHSITLPVGVVTASMDGGGAAVAMARATEAGYANAGKGGGHGMPPPGDPARRVLSPAAINSAATDVVRTSPMAMACPRPGPLNADGAGLGGMDTGGVGAVLVGSMGGHEGRGDSVGSPTSSRGSPRVGTPRSREAGGGTPLGPGPGPSPGSSLGPGPGAELLAFLQNMQLEHYFDMLHREDVSVDMLPHMDDNELRQMGVMSMGARMRLRSGASAYLSRTGPQ